MKLPKIYNPRQFEADIYLLWEKNGAFRPRSRRGEGTFSIVLPPPNANGDLHIGTALTVVIEDALARYWRMRGGAVLFVPGADHAGFETWVVYERKLNQEGKSRFDFTREELYRQVWDFVQYNKHNFESQLRMLGASCDWETFTFTLDNKVVTSSYSLFRKLWDEGLIYRGARIVNFCTAHGTGFADIEVTHEEEKTKLWHIAYPLTDGSGEVVVATTRPETMLGDSAVAVNPEDERYKHMVGKTVKLPFTGREVPIVADQIVDKAFGTGAVKVTPAHDPNDFEVAQRHKLPFIEVITTEGKTSTLVPSQFQNLTVSEARQAVAHELEKTGHLRGVEDYVHSVGKCYKCGTTIEPLLREQWFIKIQPLAEKAIAALQDKKIKFYPAGKLAQTIRYLHEVKDWNISRQIAWGIPVPAFQNVEQPNDWLFDTRVKEETISVDGKTYRRDPDVLDTWFSSGQWPFVTLDYPEGENFKKYYPLSLMETGGEILYQWVARMIMLGLYVTGEIPFKDVYIHGYVLAEDGAKMSKSLGNAIDPFGIIAQQGSDALRMGLLTGRRAGVSQGYHPAKIKAGRNFANKLWNVARFTEGVLGEGYKHSAARLNSSADHWIANRLNATAKEIDKALRAYRLSEAYELLYHFVWHDFADWYVESSKIELSKDTLALALEATLKLAHPFAPFVTEAIWQTLGWKEGSLLATEVWSELPKFDKSKAEEFMDMIAIVSEVRNISASLKLDKPQLYYTNEPALAKNTSLLIRLSRLGGVSEVRDGHGLRLTKTARNCWLDVDRFVAQSYLKNLEAQRQSHQTTIQRLQQRLDTKGYTHKAPREVVEQTKHQLAETRALLTAVEAETAIFGSSFSEQKP